MLRSLSEGHKPDCTPAIRLDGQRGNPDGGTSQNLPSTHVTKGNAGAVRNPALSHLPLELCVCRLFHGIRHNLTGCDLGWVW